MKVGEVGIHPSEQFDAYFRDLGKWDPRHLRWCSRLPNPVTDLPVMYCGVSEGLQIRRCLVDMAPDRALWASPRVCFISNPESVHESLAPQIFVVVHWLLPGGGLPLAQ